PVDPVKPPPRPEVGTYISNMQAANTLFDLRLHDRLGETQYTDALTGETKVTSMWLRNVGGFNRSQVAQGSLNTRDNRYVIQLGGDVTNWSTDGLNRYHVGVMAGYAHQNSKTKNHRNGYDSKGNTSGYSVGLYGTWYTNEADKSGLYVDTWALYNWFDHEVNGHQLATEKYKPRGMTASVESGYTFKMGEYTTNEMVNTFYLQPKAQVTWQGVKANDHTEVNGTLVSSSGENNIRTRLGLRAYLHGHNAIDEGKGRNFEPFVETNWIYNSKQYGVKMNGEQFNIAGTRNTGEVKIGIEGQINSNLNLWGNVSQQLGDSGYSDTQAMFGIKYMY
ncbi:TPA: autotransporter outer membrane beta-barrel domain-containing protein, partial [Providencia alcalifaciens]